MTQRNDHRSPHPSFVSPRPSLSICGLILCLGAEGGRGEYSIEHKVVSNFNFLLEFITCLQEFLSHLDFHSCELSFPFGVSHFLFVLKKLVLALLSPVGLLHVAQWFPPEQNIPSSKTQAGSWSS